MKMTLFTAECRCGIDLQSTHHRSEAREHRGKRNKACNSAPGLSIEEVKDIELQLSTSESALHHYRQAFALEAKLGFPESPNGPSGNEPADGDKRPERSSSRRNKDGLAKVAERSRRQPSRQCRDLSASCREPIGPEIKRWWDDLNPSHITECFR
jgi:hypothetical protein